MKLPAFPVILSILLVAFAPVIRADQTPEQFEVPVTAPEGLKFLLSLPDGYEADKEKAWPLMVFLHGAGERGDNLDLVKVHGPPKRVEAGEKFPFILASPQCPAGSWWSDEPVLELIDHLESTYRVDKTRIYLTGLSMGGYGTWHFATKAPKRFAAIAPVCGGGIPYKMQFIPHLPVWAFHGGQDSVVPLDESARLIKILRKNSNSGAKLTVYPKANHDSWTETYDNPELYKWFLSKSLTPNQ
ncbi:MAG: prolyl oligopeptidase family serine peptidase [Verrucomicrobiales bacterium]|nr:prolyl oligopeptidase family serine peptidase [Verrucomicrobiales bacterium]